MRPLIMFATTLLVMMLSATGCHASKDDTLRGYTAAATTLDELAAEAKEAVMLRRQAKLDEAADRAVENGRSFGTAVEIAALAFDSGPEILAVNAFIFAKDAYVRAVLRSASDEEPTWAETKKMLSNVIDAYANLRAAMGASTLPPIPVAIAKLLTVAPRPAGPIEAVA